MDDIVGYQNSPTARVKAAFQTVAEQSMPNFSFLHPSMPVYAADFQLLEGQWFGCVITPWMLCGLILPGPGQCWKKRQIGDKLGLKLPHGNFTFTVGEVDGIGQYLTCSLQSPLDHYLTPQQGVQLADDCTRLLLSLPVSDPNSPKMLSRRRLLSGLQDNADA